MGCSAQLQAQRWSCAIWVSTWRWAREWALPLRTGRRLRRLFALDKPQQPKKLLFLKKLNSSTSRRKRKRGGRGRRRRKVEVDVCVKEKCGFMICKAMQLA